MESTPRGLTGPLRCDLALAQVGLARSRTHAKDLIESGVVRVKRDGALRSIDTASFLVLPTDQLSVEDSELTRFVSRAGLKLEAALEHRALGVGGFHCLDIGQSTGGFTDCLLRRGASFVTGIDVGSGQLDRGLKADPRVFAFEELNAREATWIEVIADAIPARGFDLVVIDVSFISLTLVVPEATNPRLKPSRLLALVKPQFEVGPKGLDAHGVVKDPSLLGPVHDKITASVRDRGWNVLDYFPSGLRGKDGNQEFFIYAEKP